MIKRIIDTSEATYLHANHQQLLLDRNGTAIARLPIEDLGVVILQHPAIVITQAVIIACQKNNVVLVFCDERHLPYSVLLPISEGNTLHSKILQQQLNVSLATKKRLWQQVVKQKITQQMHTLKNLDKPYKPLERLADNVKTGDPDNLEAQAAQHYWRLLFGNDFRRDVELDGINSLLNYGYAIMRAMVARAIVGSGLHPALGLHHHNQYNGLCLADDLMEPFRPWIDYRVYQIAQHHATLDINRENKIPLLNLLSETVEWEQQTMPLMVACHYLMAQLKRAFEDRRITLNYPKIVRP
ncbi:MAG: type II CRISPR-associated endonuclease Cas1 [Methylococcales bacterium]|nr:type II CRISPR-associated endonuclease Cas1 [Methylococcales bacterium]